MIDSEFTPSEKLAAVNQISTIGDLAEPALWANWFSKTEVPAGKRHPMVGYVLDWMHHDSVAAGKWLEQAPPGERKDELVFNYVFVVMETELATAMQWALKLPEGKWRTRAIKDVGAKWQATDPSAAATFAKEHNLSE